MSDLYRQIIIETSQEPRYRGTLSQPDMELAAINPSCGDSFTIQLHLADPDDTDSPITAAAWQGEGCAISTAALDLLLDEAVSAGLTIPAVQKLSLDDLLELMGLEQISPSRKACVLAGWSGFDGGQK